MFLNFWAFHAVDFKLGYTHDTFSGLFKFYRQFKVQYSLVTAATFWLAKRFLSY